jgi:hypothetical protein
MVTAAANAISAGTSAPGNSPQRAVPHVAVRIPVIAKLDRAGLPVQSSMIRTPVAPLSRRFK